MDWKRAAAYKYRMMFNFANLSNNDLQKQERVMALYDRVMPAGLKDKYDSGVELVKRLNER